MTPETVIDLFRQAFLMAFWLSAPLLTVGFGAGVAINLVQIATSLQDSSFSTVPRLSAFLGALLIALPWMIEKMCTYTVELFANFSRYAG